MLTSVLPGLRELRAPLAAGVLWMLAVWLLAEPAVPAAAATTGILASLYRLAAPLSTIGLGAVLGFVAYLLGSLSVFVFSGSLRRLIPVSRDRHRSLAGLSPGGDEALRQVARDSRRRLEETLGLSGSGVDDLLGTTDAESAPRRTKPRRLPWRRATPGLALSDRNAPRTAEQRQDEALADLVVRDLEVIADTQLLGKENDVFSAVDRDRAELEFRLAVIPGLLAVTASVGLRQSSPPVAAVVLLLGSAAAAGLLFDAAVQRRAANDLLLNLLEHERLHAPSLTRLEARAKEVADQSPAAVPKQAAETITQIFALTDQLENLARSGVSSVSQAVRTAAAATRAFDRLETLLHRFGEQDGSQAPLDRSVLEDLRTILGGWLAHDPSTWSASPEVTELFPDGLPTGTVGPEDLTERLASVRRQLPVVKERMSQHVLAVTARQAAVSGVPALAP